MKIQRSILAFVLSVAAISSIFAQYSAGKESFQEAYRLENESPVESIALYRRAIQQGLDHSLLSAARWKLFYLYKKTKDYASAMTLLDQLGSGRQMQVVVDDLKKEMKEAWGATEESVHLYVRGVESLRRNEGAGEYMRFFTEALRKSPGSRKLLVEIIDRLVQSQKGSQALFLLDENDDHSEEIKLVRADLLLGLERKEEAESILTDLARSEETLSDRSRSRLLYLLGRIVRERGDFAHSAALFRMAAFYAKDQESSRQIAIAAFTLYKAGMPLQAMALLRGLPPSTDDQVELLSLLLRAEVDNDSDSLQTLRTMRDSLARNHSFLAERAIQLLQRRGRP